MKTSELTGMVLDWAVAKCLGWTEFDEDLQAFTQHETDGCGWLSLDYFHPSENWSQAGPIIERECIGLAAYESSEVSNNHTYWEAVIRTKRWRVYRQTGHAALIAAMRCLVASKMGEEVEIPKELLK